MPIRGTNGCGACFVRWGNGLEVRHVGRPEILRQRGADHAIVDQMSQLLALRQSAERRGKPQPRLSCYRSALDGDHNLKVELAADDRPPQDKGDLMALVDHRAEFQTGKLARTRPGGREDSVIVSKA
jgi:hypothetical protein